MMLSNIIFCKTGLKKKGILPGLEEVLKGRENEETMAFFCDTIIPCVVGKQEYKNKVTSDEIDRWLTCSSESFALLLYENLFETSENIGNMMNNNSELTLIDTARSAKKPK